MKPLSYFKKLGYFVFIFRILAVAFLSFPHLLAVIFPGLHSFIFCSYFSGCCCLEISVFCSLRTKV